MYIFEEYPKWITNKNNEKIIVNNSEEEIKELGENNVGTNNSERFDKKSDDNMSNISSGGKSKRSRSK